MGHFLDFFKKIDFPTIFFSARGKSLRRPQKFKKIFSPTEPMLVKPFGSTAVGRLGKISCHFCEEYGI